MKKGGFAAGVSKKLLEKAGVQVEGGSDLELNLLSAIRDAGIPEPTREAKLVPGRRFRCDFAWPEQRLVVEVEGGVWTGGRHTRGAGFESDCEKYNLLAIMGYTVLRVTGKHIDSGEAVEWIKQALGGQK